MSRIDSELESFCDICHSGSFKPCRAAYARWHDGQFVIAPGLPAWRCDFCGDTFFDNDALTRLVLLLGPESNVEDQRRWRATGLEENWEAGLDNRRRV